jgi:RNA polymerase sigma-70 factor (ECF subfamily)
MDDMETEIEERLRDVYAAASAAWPRVDVPRERFIAYARERLSLAEPRALDGPDLYLACGCWLGLPSALAELERVYLARVSQLVRPYDPSPAFADEVCQTLRERLLVGAGADARIASYSGRGSLLSWLRVAAVRIALNLLEARHPERNLTLSHVELEAMPGADPELEAIKSQYREAFQAAVTQALSALPLAQRRALRLHLVGEMTTTQIGALMQVHHSTVVRWLAAARAAVRKSALAALQRELGASAAELESLAGLVLSRLDVSLRTCLGDGSAD